VVRMQKGLLIVGTAGLLFSSVFAQDLHSRKKSTEPVRTFARNPFAPGSGEKANTPLFAGVGLSPASRGGLTGQPPAFVGGPVGVNLFQTDVAQNGPYNYREMNSLTTPVPFQVTPFDQFFRTTMATTFVRVTFSAQVWIDQDPTSADAVAIECYLKQTDPSGLVTITNCYGAPQGQWPTILGSQNLVNGVPVWVTFSSYIPAAPDQESELVVNISTLATRARIANSQLHLAF